MASERDRTLEGLKAAVQMEIDGEEFYLKASEQSSNEMGRNLLRRLSEEEDFHRRRFEGIYRDLESKQAWPEAPMPAGRGEAVRTMFAREAAKIGPGRPGPATELDAIQMAMTMENRSYDFYTERGRAAEFPAEKAFYETVAAEERVHHSLLADYYEYLKDPAQWFGTRERASLDGG